MPFLYQYILCPLPNPIRDMLVQTESQKKIHKSTKICHAVLATKVEKLKKNQLCAFFLLSVLQAFSKSLSSIFKEGKTIKKKYRSFYRIYTKNARKYTIFSVKFKNRM